MQVERTNVRHRVSTIGKERGEKRKEKKISILKPQISIPKSNTVCWSLVSGGRVSNAWATCPYEGDNTGKLVLIPHKLYDTHVEYSKDGLWNKLSHMEGPASD